MNKQVNHILSHTIFMIMVLMMVSSVVHKLLFIEDNHLDYTNFTISDWMINYEGGFVRRGLIGQCLLYLYNIHPYPLIHCITAIYVTGFILLLYITLSIFKKQGWSPIIIPSLLCFYYGFGWGTQLLSVRRDYCMLILIYMLFRIYSKWLYKPICHRFIAINVLSAVIILAYEPAFFYCVPLLTVITFCNTDKNVAIKQRSAVTRLKKTLLLWMPSYIVMATVCLNSGNSEQATVVWNSWLQCIDTFPCNANTTLIGDGVNFFNKPLPEVFKMHFDIMWSSSFTGNIPSFPFTIYTFICIPYLVVKSNVMDMNTWCLKKANTTLLIGIMFMQFIFVSPMYGLLSCDFGRTVTCIVVSSLFAYNFLNDKAITIPRLITKASAAFNRFIDRHHIFSNQYFYILALFTLPLSAYEGVRFESMLIMQILKIIYVISG